MANIVGVALNQAGKFLGFVDKKGKIRKGRVKKVRRNPNSKVRFWVSLGAGLYSGALNAGFPTLVAAKKYKNKLYSRGLLYGRTLRILDQDRGGIVVFEKSY